MTDWIRFTVHSAKKVEEAGRFLRGRGFTISDADIETAADETCFSKKCHFFIEKSGTVVMFCTDASVGYVEEELIGFGYVEEAIEEYYDKHLKFPPNYMKSISFKRLQEMSP